jgi:hypothetical protein
MVKKKATKVAKEWQLLLNGKRVVVSAGPPPTKEVLERRREHEKSFQEYVASDAYRRYCERQKAQDAEHAARIARRPVDMGRNYRLPDEVRAFLMRLYEEQTFFGLPGNELEQDMIRACMQGAYLRGCTQGFVEGFLYGEEKARPGALKNRERLRQQNLEKLERLGIADRNAEIVAEFRRLERDMPGAEDRYAHLADTSKTGRDDWPTSARQIANIVRGASKRRR